MKMRIKIEGAREIEKALKDLPRSTARATMRRVGVQALTPMMATAEALAPDNPVTAPPDLKTSFRIDSKHSIGRRVIRARSNEVLLFMGPTAEGMPQGLMQEGGTAHHPAQPFMTPAWDQHAEQALDIIMERSWAEIEKTVARRAARAARLAARGKWAQQRANIGVSFD